MITEERKTRMGSPTLDDLESWNMVHVFTDNASDFYIYTCPECHANTSDPYKHRAWHKEKSGNVTHED